MIEPVDSTAVVFAPAAMLASLARSEVEFVVIGGLASVLHGDDVSTSDADTTVRRTRDNLDRLVHALAELDGKLLVFVDEEHEAIINVPVTPETFDALTSARFLTRYGVLDVVLRPDGVPDFEDWVAGATRVEIAAGVTVNVAALEDVIASKEAAGRSKDEQALPRLRRLLALRRRGGQAPDGFGDAPVRDVTPPGP